MLVRDQLLDYIDHLLEPQQFKDYCPNGLQVAGHETIRHIVTGVTANQALIDKAIELNADTILVHHGYFWKGEDARVIGIKRERLKSLLSHDINLMAYHLPLDQHPQLGNNAQLGQLLSLIVTGGLQPDNPRSIGLVGRLSQPMSGRAFAQHISRCLKREALHIGEDDDVIETVAWCTGGAQGYLQQAIDLGVDAYITGEVSEPTVHLARETGTHFYSAGHHATERYGAQALGERIAREFDVQVTFVDIDNPV